MSNYIHENDNYAVVVKDGKYCVVNKATAVVEDEGPSLPNAINFAEHANSFLVNKLWEWIAPQGKATRDQMDTGGATELFHGVDESGLIQ
jgi:hypothetical protein